VFDYDAAALADSQWHDVALSWSDAQRGGALRIEIDGQPAGRIAAQRPAQFGVNTLRIEFRANSGNGHMFVANLAAHGSK
jgi:hypothetical protein